MAAYRRVYDSRHLQADYQEPRSAPEPSARQTSMGYLYFFTSELCTYSYCVRSVVERGSVAGKQTAGGGRFVVTLVGQGSVLTGMRARS